MRGITQLSKSAAEDIDRHFGVPIAPPAMSCDACAPNGMPCLREVKRAPRILIPTQAGTPPALPFRAMTLLHYCDLHAHAFDLRDYLAQGGAKARIERVARQVRSPDFRADFDAASYELVLTSTPEYREWSVLVGMKRVAGA